MSENSNGSSGSLRQEEFRLIYDKFYDDIFRYCLRRVPNVNEAEDLLADIFTVAWSKFDSLKVVDEALPWLYTIARNVTNNHWRKNGTKLKLFNKLHNKKNQSNIDADSTFNDADVSTQYIFDALNKLKPNDREILRLSCWEELNTREIALVLGVSENAVNIRLHRSKDRFGKILEKSIETMKENYSFEHTHVKRELGSEG